MRPSQSVLNLLCADYEELAAVDQINSELAELRAMEIMDESQRSLAELGRQLYLLANEQRF